MHAYEIGIKYEKSEFRQMLRAYSLSNSVIQTPISSFQFPDFLIFALPLMFASRSIQSIIILIIAAITALWLGVAIVQDKFETLVKVGGVALLLTAVFLGNRVWLLFIFLTSMEIVLYRWAGTVELGQALFIGFSVLLLLSRKLHANFRLGELELWTLLIIGCIVQAYIRNPVGMSLLGSVDVGGRPYFSLALWIVSAGILSTLIVRSNDLKLAFRLALLAAFMGIPGQMVPYGNLASVQGATTLDLSGSRIGSFARLGDTLACWLSSRISPLLACIRPLWALVLVIALAFAAASGYRNSVANVGAIILVATCYHGGVKSFLTCVILGSIALTLLALVNLNFPLPGNLQRALSPLPGTWEQQYLTDAEGSTEWRVDMWLEALTTEKWIKNKILGDGIGISADALARMENLESSESSSIGSSLSKQQEQMMLLGAYHSGPLHSIHMTGYVGLSVLLLAMIRLAVHAHRQMMRCKGTEWSPIALFFGIPLIVQPFFFTFIFGEYHTGVAQTVMGIAMVRLMERNLPVPAYLRHQRYARAPLAMRNRPGELQNSRSI